MKIALYDMVLDREHELGQFDDLTIGRSPLADVVIPNKKGLAEYVSRTHCILRQEGENLMIYDHWSKNGTFVNGERVSSRLGTLIQPNDLISLGPYTFRTKIEYDFEKVLRTPTPSEALRTTEVVKSDEN